MHSRFVNHDIGAGEGLLGQTPGICQLAERSRIDDQLLRHDVPDGDGGGVSPPQDLRRQLPRLLSYFMKIGPLVEKGASLRVTWSDSEHRDTRLFRGRDD